VPLRRLGSVIAVLVGLAGPTSPACAGYLEELVERARSERLAEHRAWLDLGHYRPDLFGPGYTSLIDSRGFFNAGQGKTDPQAELEATLAAFFATPERQPDAGDAEEQRQHPQCAFIARYRWLKEALDFDPARLPQQPCPEFAAWLAEIAPDRVTLVFPAAYLNNPSSMFGHTLLRLDRADQDERTRLLAYAINYGAVMGEDVGIMFAVHGLTGGYRGTYSVLPYHAMVRQYTDYENRDIWEYQLNLSQAETLRLSEHLWELRDQYANYFFFDENCSYQLLFLLDVARPGMGLTDRFPLHAIPADTVRAVVAQDGMVERTVFRPSSRTLIEHRLGMLDSAERALVDDLADRRRPVDDPAIDALAPARRAAVLELAADFVTYRMRTGERTRDEAAPLALQLLAARSQITAEADLDPVPSPSTRPDQGHGSARVAAGVGARDGRFFQFLQARPAYHDLLDAENGYVRGAQIDFLDLALRHYEGDAGITLDRLTVVGIRSLSPRNRLIKPISWQLGGGLQRYRESAGDEKGTLVAALTGGAGPTFEIGGALLNVMAEARAVAGTDCPDACFLALGPAATLIWPITERWTAQLQGGSQVLLGDRVRGAYGAALGQNLALSPNLALRLDLLVENEGGGAQTEWATSLHLYF
jgi:hypothetical protein